MNQDQVKEKLLALKVPCKDFTLVFSGKASKQVNGLYKSADATIVLHNRNFTSDTALMYTALHELTHHLMACRGLDTGRARKGNSVNEAFEAEMRRVWRALALVIKAKFEAVSSGIVSYEQEFLPFFVLPGGATVAEIMIPQLEIAYRTGKMPALLPEHTGGSNA